MTVRSALLLGLLALLIAGCAPQGGLSDAQRNAVITEALTVEDPAFEALGESAPPLPAAAEAMLRPEPLSAADDGPVTEPRFDISADAVNVSDFYHGLVEDTPYNVVVHPQISGEISLRLTDVSVPEVMEILRESYGFHYRRMEGSFLVLPSSLETRVFSLNYINVQREGLSGTSISGGEINSSEEEDAADDNNEISGSRLTTRSTSRLWADIESAIEEIIAGSQPSDNTSTDDTGGSANNDGGASTNALQQLSEISDGGTGSGSDGSSGADGGGSSGPDSGDRARVVTSPEAGSVVVRATPEVLDQVEAFLDGLQETINRQVILEARILEVTLNDQFEAGINWNNVGSREGNPGRDIELDLTSGPETGGIFEFGVLREGSFSAIIDALDEQGEVMVLSSPRVSTLNNQKALIKVGTDSFFQTGVELDTTFTDSNAQTTIDPEFRSFFSGISLDVTPNIDSRGFVTLHVQPSVSEVTEIPRTVQTANEGEVDFQLARSDVRQSDSIVRARDGELIVIGGLMERRERSVDSSVPGLGDIPPLKPLFSRQEQVSEKVELVILMRPTVVTEDTWSRTIEQQLERML